MVTRVKGKVHTSTEKKSEAGTSRISVNAPKGLKKRFIKKLSEEGLDQRSQSPTIVGWVREYVEGERERPAIEGLTPKESRLLEAYRADTKTKGGFDALANAVLNKH